MDRNDRLLAFVYFKRAVALRKESVDRNKIFVKPAYSFTVALRKESVDRNAPLPVITAASLPSLSARRAWIEIPAWRGRSPPGSVALRKESVDRNIRCAVHRQKEKRRSPQGERG